MLGGEIVRRGENGEKWGSGEACICAPFRLYLFVWRAHKTLTPSYPQHVLQPVTLPLRFSARGLFLSLSHTYTQTSIQRCTEEKTLHRKDKHQCTIEEDTETD